MANEAMPRVIANVGWDFSTSHAIQCVQWRHRSCFGAGREDFFREVCGPNVFTFLAAFKACSTAREVDLGRKIHDDVVRIGNLSSNFVATAAVDMYSSCGSMVVARRIFESLAIPDVALWNSLVTGYARNRDCKLALEFFFAMDREANARSFVAAVTACSGMAGEEQGQEIDGKVVKVLSLEKGMEIRSRAVKGGRSRETFVENSLVDMYGKCRSVLDARTVFDRMMLHDVISWNSLMAGYIESGEIDMALNLFDWIHQRCEQLINPRVYVTALTACFHKAMKEEPSKGGLVKIESLEKSMEIHCLASGKNHCDQLDLFVGNTLIEAYSKCSTMLDARRAFDRMTNHNAVSWTSLILGYADNNEAELALEIFSVVAAQGLCKLHSGTFVATLTACSSLERVQEFHSRFLEAGCYDNSGDGSSGKETKKAALLQTGVSIHREAERLFYDSDASVRRALEVMYATYGEARENFLVGGGDGRSHR